MIKYRYMVQIESEYRDCGDCFCCVGNLCVGHPEIDDPSNKRGIPLPPKRTCPQFVTTEKLKVSIVYPARNQHS